MNEKMLKLKNYIKKLAEEQKIFKKNKDQSSIAYRKFTLRIYHIAYSMLKGRDYKEIESSVKPHKKLQEIEWDEIRSIMKSTMEV